MESSTVKSFITRKKTIFILVSIIIIIRFAFSSLIDLLPEEAYYWSYAQHIDIGYLDHPPMTAWLIWLFTSILGNNEFAVRLPAILGWFLTALFIFKFTQHIFNRDTALKSLLLIAVLPIYFSIGFIMTPDAPMYIFWAGALYFLERALIANRRNAWWGLGICMGLGMLSKYTIGLVGVSAFFFMILDKDSRRWFKRPEPYLTTILAILVFSPVIIWNYLHDWASFYFQGPRRWSGGINFSIHLLAGSALILLSPVAFYESVRMIFTQGKKFLPLLEAFQNIRRHHLFMLLFSWVPLMVFISFSIHSQPKLNWTGPVWLAVIPFMAWELAPVWSIPSGKITQIVKKMWALTVIALVVIYLSGLGYLALKMPGIRPLSGLPAPIAWQAFGERVAEISDRVENDTGQDIIIAGLDQYWISSQTLFYGNRNGNMAVKIYGQHLFGYKGLMWEYWKSPLAALNKNVMVIAYSEEELNDLNILNCFSGMGPIKKEELYSGKHPIGYFYWRVGYGYFPWSFFNYNLH